MPVHPKRSDGRTFESFILAFCQRVLAQRTFDLVVGPALADVEFEAALGRHDRLAGRAAVVRAVIGGVMHDARAGSAGFLKLTLLSMSYFMFPVALSGSYFKTWAEYFMAVSIMMVLSLAPVIVCFWPERPPARPGR
jgi:hypothetical protein